MATAGKYVTRQSESINKKKNETTIITKENYTVQKTQIPFAGYGYYHFLGIAGKCYYSAGATPG
jgi:hypothetical protein